MNHDRPALPAQIRPGRLLRLTVVFLALLAAPTPLLAEGTDPQALRPLLLAPRAVTPGLSAPGLSQRHRATIYRSGLQRSKQLLEQRQTRSPRLSQPRIGTQNRAGTQSRLNATRGELSRINRALGRSKR